MATTETHEPKLIRWTRDEYCRLEEIGVFEGRRVELIKVEIFERGRQTSQHAAAVMLGAQLLRAVFEPAGGHIRMLCPLSLGEDSDPEPDVAVVTGKPRDYLDAHPTTAALIVEVADTSLEMDRGRRAFTPARASRSTGS